MDEIKCPFCGMQMKPIEFYDFRFGYVHSFDCDNCAFRTPFKTSQDLAAMSVNNGLKHLMIFDADNSQNYDYDDVDLGNLRNYLLENGWYHGSLVHTEDLFKVDTSGSAPYEAYIRIYDAMPKDRIKQVIKQISELEGVSIAEILGRIKPGLTLATSYTGGSNG